MTKYPQNSERRISMVKACVFTILFLSFLSGKALLAQHTLPFTKKQNPDGARYVWYMHDKSGFPYKYISARNFPKCKQFKPEPDNIPQKGDVAWWKEFVAIYAGVQPDGKDLFTADGMLSLKDLEKQFGPVKWFQYIKEQPGKGR